MMNLLPSYYDERNKIWSGGKEDPYYHDDCSIGRILFNTMKNYPKNVIQINDKDGVTMTNSEAITAAIRIAQHFKSMGLRQDDIVGIAARNSTYVMPVAVACFLNCTPFHAVNPINDEKSLVHIFGITKPKVIFCDGQDYDKIRRATKTFEPKIYTFTDHIDDVPNVNEFLSPTRTEHFYKPETLLQGGDQTMAILCSSGTTGMPKGVCLSNHKLLSYAGNSFFKNEDVVYAATGLDWISGFSMMLMSCTASCTRIINDKPFSAEEYVRLVKKYKVTYSSLPPRHVTALSKCPSATAENLASIRLLISGGCTVSSVQALQRVLKNAVISLAYGMTEIGGVSGNLGLDRPTSSGKVISGVRVRIVNDDGKSLGPNEVGEIYVEMKKTWNGYYGNPMETQRALDSQGWYHTGDLGYFDEDQFIYVVDRKKEILKYQDMHYWPSEIEKCIAELPDVMDVCVIGVYDENYGDLAGALVVKAKGSPLSPENIKNYVKKELVAPHKQLNAGVVFVEKLPENKNGKTVKREAKEQFIAAMSSVDR